MFDQTQMGDDLIAVTESERCTILIAIVLGCVAGAWIMADIIGLAMEAWT